MYAYIVKHHWNNYTKNVDGDSDYIMWNFLKNIGTPYLYENMPAKSDIDNIPGFFVHVPNGLGIKFDSHLSHNTNCIINKMNSLQL